MAADIEHTFPDAEVTLVPGGRGVFDVTCDGRLVFCKRTADRFPRDGEVPALLSRKLDKSVT